MNVAKWAPSDLYEREEARLLRKIAAHRVAAWPGALVTSTVIAAGLFAATFPFLLGGGDLRILAGVLLIALGLVGVLVGTGRRYRSLRADLAANDLALRESFGGHDGWFVEMRVHQGAAVTGVDRGMLWFEDDRLFFSGYRTSFALGSGDASSPPLHVGLQATLQGAILLRLDARTGAGRLAVSFSPALNQELALLFEMTGWRRAAPRQEGQLPPVRLGPGAPPRGRLLFHALLATAYWTVAVGFLGGVVRTLGESRGGVGTLFLLLGVGVVLRAWHLVRWWRAWYDLGRVER